MTAATARQPIIDESSEDARNEHQLELERIYDKHQLLPLVRGTFEEAIDPEFFKLHRIPQKFGIDCLAQIAIHKRATVAAMVGALRRHGETAQEVADQLAQCVQAGLLMYSARDQQLIVQYEISDRLQAELDKFQYPLPMVVPPRWLADNLDSGYLTGRSSVILRDNHHDDDVCLDHLNRMNSQAYSLNLDVAMTVQNKWKGLDKKDPEETWEDFKARRKAFDKYDRCARDVMQILLREGNELYLTHKYDKRGRTYCMGHHVTYQGTDWNKAIIELFEKEELTE